MPYAGNQGIRIHYKIEGKGLPLVIQHGFTSSMQRWYMHGYGDALQDDFQLILLDARGHGASDKSHDPVAYARDARVSDVVAVLDHLWSRSTHTCAWVARMKRCR